MTFTHGPKTGLKYATQRGNEMFIGNLNESQQKVLITLTKRLIAADGEVHEKEKEILEFIESQCSASLESVGDVEEIESIKCYFSDQRAVISLMLELLGVAHADESYDEKERVFLESVANDLSVPNDLMERMELWVRRQIILTKEAELFMKA